MEMWHGSDRPGGIRNTANSVVPEQVTWHLGLCFLLSKENEFDQRGSKSLCSSDIVDESVHLLHKTT